MRKRVTLDGRTLSYLEAGAGDPLLLIHAFPLSAEMWEPQLRDVPSGWRVIAPDLSGFGESGPVGADRQGLPPSMDDYADDIAALLQHLQVDRAVVGGLSMGGYVAFALLRRAPHRVRGLVLADTRPGPDSEEGRAGRQGMQALVDREGAAGVAREMLPRLLGEETHRRHQAIVSSVGAMIESAAPAGITRALQCLMTRPDATPQLAAFDRPALILVGGQDLLTPVTEAERMHQLIEGIGARYCSLRRAPGQPGATRRVQSSGLAVSGRTVSGPIITSGRTLGTRDVVRPAVRVHGRHRWISSCPTRSQS